MRCRGRREQNERGSTLAIISVSLFALCAMGAMAVDLAMLMDARSEAQRAADATALAGASAFRDYPGQALAVGFARDRALLLAAANQVRRKPIDVGNMVETTNSYAWGTVTVVTTNEVTLNIIPGDSNRVRAWVTPPAGITTFLARAIGWGMGKVQAMATAEASDGASTTDCLKPFFLPDMWHEASTGPGGQDENSNGVLDGSLPDPDGGEKWYYEPDDGDTYVRYGEGTPCTGYGCGRGTSTNDWGTQILLKPQTGRAQRQGNWYYTLEGDENNLRDQIKFGCIDAAVGDTPDPYTGGMTGQVGNNSGGATWLTEQDPGAHWNPVTNTVDGSSYGSNWIQSPRVFTVGLFDPIYLEGVSDRNEKIPPGSVYSNFIRVFLEDVDGNNNVMVRFLDAAPGGEGGPVAGTIVIKLRLIQ